MPETTVDTNAVVEAMAVEIARITHRAVVAETAVAQLQQQIAAMIRSAEVAQSDDEPQEE